MTVTTQNTLRSEVNELQAILNSARQAAPQVWKSVSSALNAVDAAILANVKSDAPSSVRLASGYETTSASRMEVPHE